MEWQMASHKHEEPRKWQNGCSPGPVRCPMLTKFRVVMCLNSCVSERLNNVVLVGDSAIRMPMTYTRACSYCTNHDMKSLELAFRPRVS